MYALWLTQSSLQVLADQAIHGYPPVSELARVAIGVLVICRVVNLALEYGNCDASCLAYG